jgi:hypothetical protein
MVSKGAWNLYRYLKHSQRFYNSEPFVSNDHLKRHFKMTRATVQRWTRSCKPQVARSHGKKGADGSTHAIAGCGHSKRRPK